MLREHDNDGKEQEHLLHATEEEFDESSGPSVFGTFFKSQKSDDVIQNDFKHSNSSDETLLHANEDSEASDESDDDSVRRPLFISFKANDPKENFSDALREQNNSQSHSANSYDFPEDELNFDDLEQQHAQAIGETPYANPTSFEDLASAIPETPYGTPSPSALPQYEADNALEDEINAFEEDFSSVSPFAAFKPLDNAPASEPEPEKPESVSENVQETVEAVEETIEQPAVEETVSEVVEEAIEAPIDDNASYIDDAPIDDLSASFIDDAPIDDPNAFIDETPIDEPADSYIDESSVENAPIEEVSAEEATDEESAFEEAAVEEAPVAETIEEAPVAETVEEAIEEVVEEPIVEEPIVEETVEETPTVEETAANEPIVEESSVPAFGDEEPQAPVSEAVVEEPVTEEPTVEEAATEAPTEEAHEEPEKNMLLGFFNNGNIPSFSSEENSTPAPLYDETPIEDPTMGFDESTTEEAEEDYQSIYRESDSAQPTETSNYSQPVVMPNVSIASTNLEPVDKVYNARPANRRNSEVSQNHLLFGDEDEETFNKQAREEAARAREEAERQKQRAADPSSNLRPGSGLGGVQPQRTTRPAAVTEPEEKPEISRPATSRPAAQSTSRPGAARPISTSAQIVNTQHLRYSAASQKGASITPVSTQEHNERKPSVIKPLIFACLGVLCIGGVVFCWKYFDLGKSTTSVSRETTYESKTYPTTASKSDDETSETTTEESKEETTTTTTAESTTKEETTTTTTEEPTTTTTEATTTTTEATTTTTAEPTTTANPGVAKTSFKTSITNAKASGDECSFDIKFENSGSKTSTLNASIEYVTIRFDTSATITEVTSAYFTAVPKDGSKNTFLLYPKSDEEIAKGKSILADINAKGDSSIGSFKIKDFYVSYNK
ncbi:MAG: hypothetical protein J6Y08_00825 [Clostridiales bacterium]|nr:hypothetical protein [Clostridiales bacterium]